jgi:hypothetical protein
MPVPRPEDYQRPEPPMAGWEKAIIWIMIIGGCGLLLLVGLPALALAVVFALGGGGRGIK